MSSRHSSRKRSRTKTKVRSTKHLKSGNVIVIKLIDPIVQSVLVILFLYSIDGEFHFSSRLALYCIFGWQIVSVIANFIINAPNMLKNERWAYLITAAVFLPVFYYLAPSTVANIPTREIALETGAVVIIFWYFIICFREIRSLLSKLTDDE